MTPDENVEAVGRFLEAVLAAQAGGDYEPVLAELDPAVEIDDLDIALDTEHFTGYEAFRKWIGIWNDAWESWRIEDAEFIAVGEDQVISLFTMFVTGAGSGMELERPDAITFKLRNGKIVAIAYYNDQAQAREAIGLVT
jgi:ketosteroid isomerase-like protein